uniref:Uncharacterized protein n=1 Tax=Bursaphelenchus xylophilus TaxID=6326 RepID=A0A1I7S563_BURXY
MAPISGTRMKWRRWKWFRVIIFLLMAVGNDARGADQMFELHPEYIDLFLHRATTVALFEAKARKELRKLSNSEEVIFKECASSAKTVLAMAKCVNRVLDTRDKMNADIVEDIPADNNCDFDHSDGNWVMGLMRTIYRTFGCPNKENEEEKKKKKEFTMKIDIKKANHTTSESLFPKPAQRIIHTLYPARLRYNRTSRLDALRRRVFQFGPHQRTIKFNNPEPEVQGKERSRWERRRPKLDIKRLRKRETSELFLYVKSGLREHASLKKIHPQKMYKHARSTNGLLKDPFAYFCESRSIRSNNIHLRPPTEATNAPSKNLRSFVH